MPNLVTQQQLADAISYSQSRVSEATGSEDELYPTFLDEPFDPDEYAVTQSGQFQGYDPQQLPGCVRQRLEEEALGGEENSGASQQGGVSVPAFAPPAADTSIQNAGQVFLPKRAVEGGARFAALMRRLQGSPPRKPDAGTFLSQNDVHLQREQTDVSVVPDGTDVSRSVGYGSVGYVVETAVRQDPALAWAALGLTGCGVGAYAGYQAEGTTQAMAAGAAAGTAATLASGLIGVAVTR